MVFTKVRVVFSKTDSVILECDQVDSEENTYILKEKGELKFILSHLKVWYIEFINE